jgi:hypothetical protein
MAGQSLKTVALMSILDLVAISYSGQLHTEDWYFQKNELMCDAKNNYNNSFFYFEHDDSGYDLSHVYTQNNSRLCLYFTGA